ncbi:MAG: alpha-amylase family glycosyl hydrolase, partial [Actinomycetota bacterium]|nr:alpha-amylase family glycosyl hydrolase [Actinomycetota bacterium]
MNHAVPTPPLAPVARLLGAGSRTLLGVTRTTEGTNVAVHAPQATSMHLCLLGDAEERVALPERTAGVWHGLLEPLAPGTRYGLRADGPHTPALSLRFDADQLLLDPYARAVSAHADGWCAIVTDPADDEGYDWGDDAHPRHPWERTVIYEAHVRGLSMRHPGIPDSLRGTYAGVAHPAVTEELVALGVTAIELLPVHQFASEPGLNDRGVSNYWGYNPLGFFAPHGAYAARPGAQLREVKDMVRALHAAGIEVLLDVVHNHTAEGGPDRPPLSLRGLDDEAYYLQHADGSGYLDVTGCGNTVQA